MLYFDDFMEAIENLPADVADSLSNIQQLDSQVQDSVDDINAMTKVYFDSCRQYRIPEYERTVQADTIISEYHNALSLSSEKKEIAGKLSQMYDKVVRKLDSELEKFRLELEADNSGITEQIEQKVQSMLGSGTHPFVKSEKRRSRNRVNQHLFGSGSGHHHYHHHHHYHNNKAPSQYMRRKIVTNAFRTALGRRVANVNTVSALPSSTGGRPARRLAPSAAAVKTSTKTGRRRRSRIKAQDDEEETKPLISRRTHHTEIVDETYQNLPSELHRHSPFSTSALPGGSRIKLESDQVDVPERYSSSPYRLPSDDRPINRSIDSFELAPSNSPLRDWSSSSSLTNRKTGRGLSSRKSSYHRRSDVTAVSDDSISLQSWSAASDSDDMRGLLRRSLVSAPAADGHFDAVGGGGDSEDEQRYCLCHDVSYGDMVACDAPNCPIEWFHYACVNLTVAPKGQWFCPQCRTGNNSTTPTRKRFHHRR